MGILASVATARDETDHFRLSFECYVRQTFSYPSDLAAFRVDQVNLKSILSIVDDFIERNFFFIPWAPLSPGKRAFYIRDF